MDLQRAEPQGAPAVGGAASALLTKDPSLDSEFDYFAQGVDLVIGVDEVGRGAIAGPVAVGVHVVQRGVTEIPHGLRDSKLLAETHRQDLYPRVTAWGVGAVGYGSAEEIDAHGITRMLGEAARRALAILHRAGVPVENALILLDGQHDWLTPVLRAPLQVRTRVRADRECASVAAASIRAKVARDTFMRESHEKHPHYSWDSNKGYGARAHYSGIEAFGLTDLHRRTWIRKPVAPDSAHDSRGRLVE